MLNSKSVKKVHAPIQLLALGYLVLWGHEANSILARITGSSALKIAVEIVQKDSFSINSSPSRPVQSLNFYHSLSHSFGVKASQNQSHCTSPGINCMFTRTVQV